MEQEDIEVMLERFRQTIPVNSVLKRNLSSSLVGANSPRAKGSLFKRTAVLCALAAAALLLVMQKPGRIGKLSASSLKVENHISFVDLGGGGNLGVSEHNGTLYIPISGRGVFAYDESGFNSVYDKEVNWARVSPDGTRLALSTGGVVGVLDIRSGQYSEVLKGSGNTYFEEPSWSADGKRLVCTRKVIEPGETHGFLVRESVICQVELDTLETQDLASGSYPSYVKGDRSIVFERQGKVIIKNLDDGIEAAAGEGRFPSVDPQGILLTYVKEAVSTNSLTTYASVRSSVWDIWVADVENPSVGVKVTSNYPHKFVDEKTWLDGLQPSEIPQVLSFSGAYTYYNPVWAGDSKSVFVLKNSTSRGDNPDNMRLVRVDLSQKALSPQGVVKRFIQALIKRDEDYARSLMRQPGGSPLTLSNPSQVGYKVLSSGMEQGESFVEAEVYWQYRAQPYYQIVRSRFHLSDQGEGYLIDRVTEISNLQVYEKGGVVYLDSGTEKTAIIEKTRIGDYLALPEDSSCKISSLAYLEDNPVLIMAFETAGENESERAWLTVYNLEDGEFRFVDEIGAGARNSGASKLTLSPDGRYVSVDLFLQDDNGIRNTVYVFDILRAENLETIDAFVKQADGGSTTSGFWSESGLLFEMEKDGQVMSYLFRPETGQIGAVLSDR